MVKMKALKDLHAPSGYVKEGEEFEIDEESAKVHEKRGSAERVDEMVSAEFYSTDGKNWKKKVVKK